MSIRYSNFSAWLRKAFRSRGDRVVRRSLILRFDELEDRFVLGSVSKHLLAQLEDSVILAA